MNAGRYADCAPLTRQEPAGRSVSYLAIRILPAAETLASSSTVTVRSTEVDRLDLVAARALGDPLQACRIADANDAINPFELCREVGAVLKLPAISL